VGNPVQEHPLHKDRHKFPAFLDCSLEPPAAVGINCEDRLPLLHPAPFLGVKKDTRSPVMGRTRCACQADQGLVVHFDHVPGRGGIDYELMAAREDVIRADVRIPPLDLDDLPEFFACIPAF